MPETPDHPTPPRRAPAGTSRSNKRTRFVLPADHHDDRIGERIEAFLDGPEPAARRGGRARHLRSDHLKRPRALLPLDTRTDWDAALRQEDARVARYGRPASVVVVSLALADPATTDRYASRIGTALRAHARETDRVARVGPARFHLLLPETMEAEATALASRLRDACCAVIGSPPPLEVRAVAASVVRGGTLSDALRRASLVIAD